MRKFIGRRLFRLGQRLLGFDPAAFVGFGHAGFADQDRLAKFVADVWFQETTPIDVDILIPRENGDATINEVKARQRAMAEASSNRAG